MKRLPLDLLRAIALCLILNPYSLAWGSTPEGAKSTVGTPHKTVVELSPSNYDEYINDPANGFWFLKFYAPWCGHCKKLAPTLSKIAPYLEGKMAIGTVDCTRHKKLCERYDVKGYPTLKIYRDGDFFDYPGNRDADSIIDFAEKMSSNPVAVVTSLEDALENVAAKSTEKVAFVAYDPAANGETAEEMLRSTKLTQVFGQIARKYQAHGYFGIVSPGTTAEEVAKFEVPKSGENDDETFGPFVIKIEKGFQPKIFDGEMTSPDFLDFVKANNVATVTDLSAHNFRAVGNMGKILAIGVVNPKDERRTADMISELQTVAKSNPEGYDLAKYNLCYMDGKKWSRFLEQFDVRTDALPQLLVLNVPNRTYWQNASIAGVDEFLAGVASGDIEMKKQGDRPQGGGGGILSTMERMFVMNLPWSLFGLLAIFGAIFFWMLPEMEEGRREPKTVVRDSPAKAKEASDAKEAAAHPGPEDESKKEK